ncbi:MAG: fimbria/pilus periplasmic chaperone [Klebsiella huaxiensis]|uniref:fimbrial biogenesis chaperone n=1 Tax=Klebsiella huaxiensis TaxID=2153354 RepID=UPI0026F0C5A8|nr:fimbria/pilus periplasmic chaperone [Klebsiella huaxiensis]WEJ88815.1 MAG: fimbria/pilus periplasmic chaperone [Klebsiella huaxiensis]
MNIQFKSCGLRALSFLVLLTGCSVQAAEPGGITIGGTRIIYDGNKKETTLSVTNSDSKPYLIQSWTETQAGGADKAPFIITPPLFRLEGHKQNLLRIIRTSGNLPDDRESLYWLNVKSIPAGSNKEGANTLQIAIKTRIKLIYRPKSLKEKPEEVTEKLVWRKEGSHLTVTNPTPFVMNFQQVKIGNEVVKNANYVMPMTSATFTLPATASGAITWKLISDYGGIGALHSNK